ncbi:putative zinc finger protein 840 isoform X2 [Eupeodes corollae]|uniref:putative zinc finger protein 840 isoform X2 n=1 Tax=Eupeodes corollae TaxID=290404 RepID=UPI00248F9140|nr:putative zinc finger protein 840 isoform X2 [Eupeodes corollae]
MALPLEFRDICRACMKRRDDMKMFFFSRINSVNVASMLTKIALLPVEPSDSLPKVLCSICIKKLNDAYNFQQMCIKSHISFNDMLQTQQQFPKDPGDVVIKKEPCDLAITSVESQSAEVSTLSADKNLDKVLKEPKIEPGTEENSQETNYSMESSKYVKSVNKTKTFSCNFCRDVFETWNELNIHIAEHKVRNNLRARADDSSCDVPEKRRKTSEASTSKEVSPSELGYGPGFSGYDGRSENNSLDGLPLEPICNVQVKDEIVSDQSSCEYDEEDNNGSVINEHFSTNVADNDEGECNGQGGENHIYERNIDNEHNNKNGRNFTDSKSEVCEMCGFKPKIPALMHAHVRNRHPDNYMEYVENLKASGEWVVKCRICDVYLFSSTIYGQHLKYTHSQIVNDCSGYFECNHCDQTFSSKNDFFLHKNQAHNMRRINKAKQLFICLLCDKQFARYVNLQQHEETHESNGTSAMAIGGGGGAGRGSVSRVSSVSGSSAACIPLSGFLRKKVVEPPPEDVIEAPPIVPYLKISPKKYTNSNITTSAGGKFRCTGCDKSFATEFGLRVHIGCVHKGMEKLPPKKSTSASVAPQAKKPSPPPPPPPPTVTENFCEICEKQFDSALDCAVHMKKHYEVAYTYRERPIRCKECKFQCALRSEFTNHIKQKHKEIYKKRINGLKTMAPNFEACNICLMPLFHTKTIRHINSHYMSENEKREDTDTALVAKLPLTISKSIKNSPKDHSTRLNQNGKTIKYKCKICSTLYPDKSSLMKHTLIVHKKNDGRKHFNCKICFRSISGLQNFNSHMNSHKGELPKATPKNSHACHLCSGIFVEREDLQKHLVVAHSFNPMIFYKK